MKNKNEFLAYQIVLPLGKFTFDLIRNAMQDRCKCESMFPYVLLNLSLCHISMIEGMNVYMFLKIFYSGYVLYYTSILVMLDFFYASVEARYLAVS